MAFDYPRLGQTKDFLLVGVDYYPNRFTPDSTRSDVLWVSKPQGTRAIGACPAQSTYRTGRLTGLRNVDGSQAYSPVPAVQVDASHKGWITASADVEAGGSATF